MLTKKDGPKIKSRIEFGPSVLDKIQFAAGYMKPTEYWQKPIYSPPVPHSSEFQETNHRTT